MATKRSSGQVIRDQYRLIKVIGHGGMAVVWQAYDLKNGNRFVALKFLTVIEHFGEDQVESASEDQVEKIAAHQAHTARLKARFMREADQFVALRHPNVVTIRSLDVDDDGDPFIVMDYLEGQTLDKILIKYQQNRSELSPPYHPQLYNIMYQLLDGLEYLHQQDFIHRDLKPQNIFVTQRDGRFQVYILDFGIALKMNSGLDPLTVTGTILGTPLYMAPEQILPIKGDMENEWKTGTYSDIFAVATILYEAVTGHPSLEVSTQTPNGEFRILVQNFDLDKAPADPRDFLPSINQALRGAIMEGMEKRPWNRTPNVAAFRHRLQEAERIDRDREKIAKLAHVSPEKTQVQTMPPHDHLPAFEPRSSSRSSFWFVFCSAVILLGIVAGYLGFRHRDASTPEVRMTPVTPLPVVRAPLAVSSPPVHTAITIPPPTPPKPPPALSSGQLADQWLKEGIALREGGNCKAALEVLAKAESNRPDDPAIIQEEMLCEKRPKALMVLRLQLKAAKLKQR